MIRAGGLALWLALLGLALTCIALLNREHARANDGLPIVRSDYPLCVTVTPPPLVPKARGKMAPHQSDLS